MASSLLAELKRRRVYRVLVTYAAAAFVILQAADLVLPALGIAPGWYRVLVLTLLGGFPLALVLAWMFDWTEDGIRRTVAADGIGIPARTSTVRFSLGIVALVVLGGAAWWLRPALLSGKVAAGADVIAVLPFRASGVDAALGEGMVDLLSTNLDELGPIRTVDPVRVTNAAGEAGDGPLATDQALELGRRLGAGSVLMGTLSGAGAEVRLDAQLVTVDGQELARARADGPRDHLLALVDSLSLRLTREIWMAREPIPSVRLSGVTTGSPEALREYLRGEQHFRRTRWDSAATHFQRAVAIDSTFALAHVRLARTYGWTETLGSPRSVDASRKAWAQEDRLPQRERWILAADELWHGDREARPALDTLQAYLERYPDDVDAWSLYADIRYHARQWLDLSDAEVLEPFERVYELDPMLAPALLHTLDLTLAAGDSAAYADYLARYRRAADEEGATLYTVLGETVFGGGRDLGETLALVNEQRPYLLGSLLVAALRTGKISGGDLVAAVERGAPQLRASGGDVGWYRNAALYFQALGRLEHTDALLDSLAPLDRNQAVNHRLLAIFSGVADSTFLGGYDLGQVRAGEPWGAELGRLTRVLMALNAGDVDGAEALLAEPVATDAPGPVGHFTAARGWLAVLQGDTARGVQLLEEGIALAAEGDNIAANNVSFPRFQLLATRALWSGGGPDDVEALRRQDLVIPALEVRRHRALGRALERRGDRTGAAAAYRRWLTLMDGADPAFGEDLDEVRARLARLEGGGRG